MDGCRDTRPDVEAAGISCRSRYRGEQRLDDIVDENEIAQDPSVFVDVQRALLTCQSREESNYSGVRICQRLTRSVDILQTQHTEIGVMGSRPGGQDVFLGEFGRGVDVGRPGLRSPGATRKRDNGFAHRPLRVPDTGQELGVAARRWVEQLRAGLPSALAVDGSRRRQDELVRHQRGAAQGVEKLSRSHHVHRTVARCLGERLRRSCLGRQVDDLRWLEQPKHGVAVSSMGDIAGEQPH